MHPEPAPGGSDRFQDTPWSLVRASDDVIAMDRLLRIYWKPVYFYVRRHGHDAESARDVVQEFFATLLQREAIRHAEPRRGRFRTFLITALRNFLADRSRAAHRIKRGGGRPEILIDFSAGEPAYVREAAPEDSPDQAMNRAWARSLWEHALADLRGEPAHLQAFRMHAAGSSYEDVCRATGLSPAAARTAIHRLKERFRELLVAQIRRTVEDDAELDSEISEFRQLLS